MTDQERAVFERLVERLDAASTENTVVMREARMVLANAAGRLSEAEAEVDRRVKQDADAAAAKAAKEAAKKKKPVEPAKE